MKRGFKNAGVNFFIEYPSTLKGGKYISIGDGFYCFGRLRMEAFDKHNGHTYQPEIVIGNGVSINFDCHIAAVNKIVLGNGVLLASKVFITDHYHGGIDSESIKIPPSKRIVQSKGPVIIEDNVWIGQGVAIMPDVTIGKNSIIGANAVVTKSFPPNSIIGGVPARLIKTIN
jgi:acetyltransferase-like isoleucine patch superfamily enzyme